MKRLIVLAVVLIVLLFGMNIIADKFSVNIGTKTNSPLIGSDGKVKIESEESVVINAVKKVGPSVVTVVENAPPVSQNQQNFNYGPFSVFGFDPGQSSDQTPEPQSIGSGFVVSKDGLIVTNKHVVSDTGVTYQVITADDKKYTVQKIYRDPLNDVAIIKVDANNLTPVELGTSDNLQVGQFVIAIGNALGEFRNTVTTGVISGLGRGITAGDSFAGFAEKLDNVIQTDAAINPGNSGGPLLNSSSQVIGVNTAVSSQGQNIGFALPINAIKTSIDNFNKGGQFNRAYMGVSYTMLDSDVANINDLPVGAYLQQVVSNSPADKAGLQRGDVVLEINGKKMEKGKFELSSAIDQNKVGDKITIKYWRNGSTNEISLTLGSTPNQ